MMLFKVFTFPGNKGLCSETYGIPVFLHIVPSSRVTIAVLKSKRSSCAKGGIFTCTHTHTWSP